MEAKSNGFHIDVSVLEVPKFSCACCPIRICHDVPQIHLVNTRINKYIKNMYVANVRLSASNIYFNIIGPSPRGGLPYQKGGVLLGNFEKNFKDVLRSFFVGAA